MAVFFSRILLLNSGSLGKSFPGGNFPESSLDKRHKVVYICIMTITQTVEIPADQRSITLEIPREIPAGKTIISFTPAAEEGKIKYTTLLSERAVSMTAEVIEKYRPALEKLAKQ